jgi:small subunit ribosomal protein S2
MKSLLEAGVHFGHRTRRWNPKMKSYIFTERNGVHIIDLQQTMSTLNEVTALVRDTVAEGGSILFVGTKRQAQETIKYEAERCNMPYVSQRWLGGTMTNWRTIRSRIDHLLELEARRDRGEFELLPNKKEALWLHREIKKLNYRLGGIKQMERLPDLLFVVDVLREVTAVKEANKLKIPVIAMVDTNCDPDLIDYVIPANDDAIRSIKLITSLMADAVLDGIALQKSYEEEQAAPEEALEEDEKYLSAATLERLKELSFEEEQEAEQGEGGFVAPEAEAAEEEEEPAPAEAPAAEEEPEEAKETEEAPEAEEATETEE